MSLHPFLAKLLDGAEVVWKPVSEIFHLRNGYTPSKSNNDFWEDGTIPWFRMEDIRERGRILNDSLQKVSPSALKGGNVFPENSIIIATSATIGEHALITVPFLANQRFTCLSLKQKYKNNFNIKFIFYYCFLLADWCKKNTTMSSFASVDMDGFRKYAFPIPCPDNPEKSLAIQGEIVRILDAFTAMTAELTAELNMRKKQYNYYRDWLLTPSSSPLSGGELETPSSSPLSGGELETPSSSPLSGGELETPSSSPLSGGELETPSSSPLSGGELETPSSSPLSGGEPSLPPVKGGMRGVVEWKTLGEVAAYSNTRISFDWLDETNYVGVDNLLQNRAGKTESNYAPDSGNFTEYREHDILIGNIRPYLKKYGKLIVAVARMVMC